MFSLSANGNRNRALSGRLRQFRAVGMHLPDRFEDVIHVAAVGQEHVLAHRDGRFADPLVAFQFLEAFAVDLEAFGAPQPLVAARGDGFVEQAVAPEKVAGMECFLKEKLKVDWQFLFVVGVLFGALASAWLSVESDVKLHKVEHSLVPEDLRN